MDRITKEVYGFSLNDKYIIFTASGERETHIRVTGSTPILALYTGVGVDLQIG